MAQKLKFFISLLGFTVMFYIMNTSGKPLKTSATPRGILDLEFANTEAKVNVVLTAWAPSPAAIQGLINVAKINTYWDFLYLFFYGWLLYNLCKLIYHKLPVYGKFGFLFSRFAILAALLDVIENAFMLGVLNGSQSPFGLTLMVTVSMLKWAIVAVVILYCVVGLLGMAKKAIFKA
jgi:hypothetical protein